jgi:hypothetical protein
MPKLFRSVAGVAEIISFVVAIVVVEFYLANGK